MKTVSNAGLQSYTLFAYSPSEPISVGACGRLQPGGPPFFLPQTSSLRITDIRLYIASSSFLVCGKNPWRRGPGILLKQALSVREFEIVCNAAEQHDIYFGGGGGAGFNEPSTSMQMSST